MLAMAKEFLFYMETYLRCLFLDYSDQDFFVWKVLKRVGLKVITKNDVKFLFEKKNPTGIRTGA